MHRGWRRNHMKKTVSAHVYNTIQRYPQILKTPTVEKAMGNLKCWMALRVNRGFDNSSDVVSQKTGALQCLPDEISQGTRSECQGFCMLESFHDEVSPSPAMGLARSPLKNGLTTCTPYLIRSVAFNWKVFGWVGKPIRQTKMEMCSFLVQSRGVAKNW